LKPEKSFEKTFTSKQDEKEARSEYVKNSSFIKDIERYNANIVKNIALMQDAVLG
jgi:hypothetical protein